ncbi:Imm63 family immunity protein [Collimonas pratensis]|uniref:Imm63 family immunity protein n=1 Tax=Collimonas pratensis TaxID=279113 RepID=UPI0009EE8E18|nr:Imm63 family immunity protein [Collimonas pratensis]
MIAFSNIQDLIYEYGAKISAPNHLLRIFDSPQPDGTPYIKITDDLYLYIVEERGYEFERRHTDDLDVLCYWLMKNIISNISMRYELEHRIELQDFRRILFSKQLQLFASLNLKWLKIREAEINETCQNSPYVS